MSSHDGSDVGSQDEDFETTGDFLLETTERLGRTIDDDSVLSALEPLKRCAAAFIAAGQAAQALAGNKSVPLLQDTRLAGSLAELVVAFDDAFEDGSKDAVEKEITRGLSKLAEDESHLLDYITKDLKDVAKAINKFLKVGQRPEEENKLWNKLEELAESLERDSDEMHELVQKAKRRSRKSSRKATVTQVEGTASGTAGITEGLNKMTLTGTLVYQHSNGGPNRQETIKTSSSGKKKVLVAPPSEPDDMVDSPDDMVDSSDGDEGSMSVDDEDRSQSWASESDDPHPPSSKRKPSKDKGPKDKPLSEAELARKEANELRAKYGAAPIPPPGHNGYPYTPPPPTQGAGFPPHSGAPGTPETPGSPPPPGMMPGMGYGAYPGFNPYAGVDMGMFAQSMQFMAAGPPGGVFNLGSGNIAGNYIGNIGNNNSKTIYQSGNKKKRRS